MGLGLVCYVNRFSVLSPFLTSWKGQTLNICSFTHVSSVSETFFVLSNDFSLLFLQCSSGTSKGLSLSSDIFLLDLSCRRGSCSHLLFDSLHSSGPKFIVGSFL